MVDIKCTPVDIKVSKVHIEKGTPGRQDCCPVALSIREHLPRDYEVSVGNYNIRFRKGEEFITGIPTPRVVAYFVHTFDNYHHVTEIDELTFSILVPAELLEVWDEGKERPRLERSWYAV